MTPTLYTAAAGFDKAEIMRRAWAEATASKYYRLLTLRQRRAAFADALRAAWRLAKNQRAAADQQARTAVLVALDTRTPAQIATDAAATAREVNALGCDAFRRAA